MQWTHYFHNIIGCYLVIIKGWTERIPFTNLSTASSALPDLELLLRLWESGGIFWKKLSEAEYEALCHERDAKLNSGELVKHTQFRQGGQAHMPEDHGSKVKSWIQKC